MESTNSIVKKVNDQNRELELGGKETDPRPACAFAASQSWWNKFRVLSALGFVGAASGSLSSLNGTEAFMTELFCFGSYRVVLEWCLWTRMGYRY
jgi:hypothetical protein